MHLPPSLLTLLSLLLLCPAASSADSAKPALKPCTLHSPSSGSFFDLRPLQISPPPSNSKSVSSKDAPPESWHAKGYDYGANFTLNFCGPVVEELEDVEGVDESRWTNVSAYYKTSKGKIYSIGEESDEPIFRGRKLVLNYTMGSPCPELDKDGWPKSSLKSRAIIGGDDDDDDEDDEDDNDDKDKDDDDDDKPAKPPSDDNDIPDDSGKFPSGSSSNRYKSTILSFICDRDPSLTSHPQISFIGSPDSCAYFFEVRSRHACPGVSTSHEAGTIGPGGVFGVILAIALLAYLVGGCAYQRTVMHQRGWKQIPNYGVWAGILGFIGDMFIILFSSCTRHMPSFSRAFNSRGSAGGYHRVGSSDPRPASQGRGRTADDENRLIDQLDEEWDD